MSRQRAGVARGPEASAPDWTALATALIEREVAGGRGDETALAAADRAVQAAESAFAAALDDDVPLAAIAAAADLDATDIRVLAVCGAVELDRRLQVLVGRLRHAPPSGRLDVELLARLLGPSTIAALAPDSALSRAELIHLEDGVPFAAAQLLVPRAVAWAMLGDLSLDPGLPRGAEVAFAPPTAVGRHGLVLVRGEDRTRRLQTALVATAGLAFLVSPAPADDAEWRAVVRQATVGGLGVILEVGRELPSAVRYWIERAEHLSWGLCSTELLPLESLPQREFVELSTADSAADDAEWRAVFPDAELPARRPTAQQLRLARLVAHPADDPQVAIRRVASGTLLQHARRVVPQVCWDDLILPPAHARRLHDLVDRYRHRRTVHEEWGLSLYPSPGVVALFSGPSGTGKTTTAEVIAHELGIDLFRVDLSALVSKYIGETEKNLEEIFAAAHAGDYLLLFDEADSLFGTRSKVSDARDRYANMEVSYLLQRLETYDGFVILTSNFQGNIDTAFLRRIHVTVHFPVPGAEDRHRIWARCLAQAPQDDLDLAFVADKFDLTGGSIRNAALSAAFLAAAGGSKVGMAEVLRAVAEEMTKLGRRPTDDQFGRWLPLLGGSPASR